MRSSRIAHPGPATPWLLYWVGRLWLWLFGWKLEGEPPQAPKGVIVAAPHTSNWDLPHMLACAFVLRVRVSFFIKHTAVRFPFGWLMRLLGAIPIDRREPQGLVQQMADTLRATPRLYVAVPPAGTRSKREHWKSGFYWIAHTAQVPIICGYLDYGTKTAGLGFSIQPTGDVAADMELIRAHYEGKQAKFPALQTPVRLEDEVPQEAESEPERKPA